MTKTEEQIGKKFYNERLGITGKLVSICKSPSFNILDEIGKSWGGAINSPFEKEWKELGNTSVQDKIIEKYNKGESFDAECPIGSGKTISIMKIAQHASIGKKEVMIIVFTHNQKRQIEKMLNLSWLGNNRIKVVTKEIADSGLVKCFRPDLILVDEMYGYDWKVLANISHSEDLQKIQLYSNPKGFKHYKFE